MWSADMPWIGPEGREQLKSAGRVGAVGIEMALSTAVGIFLGKWLDRKLGTAPWLMWIGFGVGLVAAFYSLYQVAARAKKDMEQGDR